MYPAPHLDRARNRGVSPLVYWIVRAIFQPFFHVYFRMGRIGREHIPRSGPVILASNHRSFLDPFVIGMLTRRPVYYMAKQELFVGRVRCWMLVRVGAFPVQRGAGDRDSMSTARTILNQDGIVLMFLEGTRIRRGPLGAPQRGVGRLALETGAPVVPVAIHGTQDVRRGWRVRPRRVRVRAGRPLRLERVDAPSSRLTAAVTDRIWSCVALQWEWLGGTPPIRRAAVIGAGAWGTAVAVALGRAGVDVQLGAQTTEQALELALDLENVRHLPSVELRLAQVDLVCLAVGGAELPAAIDALQADVPARVGMLLLAGHAASVRERLSTHAIAALGATGAPVAALAEGASLVVGSRHEDLAAQLADVLRRAGLRVRLTDDIAGVQLVDTTTGDAAPADARSDAVVAVAATVHAKVHQHALGE